MKNENFDFVRVAVASPEVVVANPQKNAKAILALVKEACEKKVSVLVFPHLSLTGASCGDLLVQKKLLDSAKAELLNLAKNTKKFSLLFSVGLPILLNGNYYSVQAWLFQGKIIALIPENPLNSFFATNVENIEEIQIVFLDSEQAAIPFGKIRIQDSFFPSFSLVSCFDTAFVFDSARLLAGNILAYHGKDRALVGKKNQKRLLLKALSKEGNFSVLFASPPPSESTSEFVYSAHNLIVERGEILSESYLEENRLLISEIDLGSLAFERFENVQKFNQQYYQNQNKIVQISLLGNNKIDALSRFVKADVFIPKCEEQNEIFSQIFQTQVLALSKRIKHIGCKKIILGLSGGLDSTLAFIVSSKTLAFMGLDSKNLLAISMPGFGTTEKTKMNGKALAKAYDSSYREISIEKAVKQHFFDIEQDEKKLDIVFENAQARERTQILMDLANKEGALLVGTGNMSELALGWTTYNGDHMSMYALNSGIPKTLVSELLRFEAKQLRIKNFLQKAESLDAIFETAISPELLPPVNGKTNQKTESLIGPYILHDFFMYYFLRFGFSPKKIFFLAKQAFIIQKDFQEKSKQIEIQELQLSEKKILTWLEVFYKRFFSQQFKRSCAPDGITIGKLSFIQSAWSMPSDASVDAWLEEIEEIKKSL